jgi:hypothetical protein
MAQTNQTIAGFYQQANLANFARDFNFRVLAINSPGFTMTDSGLLVYAKAAALPARDITNVQVPYMGMNFNLPGTVSYPDAAGYNITFYADEGMVIRQLFENWTRYIFDDATSTGNYNTPGPDSTVTLVQLDNQLNQVAQYTLVGVSPRSVGTLGYTMAAGTGNALELPVTLAYHYFVRTFPTANVVSA